MPSRDQDEPGPVGRPGTGPPPPLAPGVSRRITTPTDQPMRDAWNEQAAAWIAWARAPMHDSYWRFHRDQFLRLLPTPGDLTVDVGAGEGRLTRDLRQRGHRVVAVDASLQLATAAREADPSTRVAVADAARLPLRAGVADLVVAFMSLQDIDDLAGAVGEMARLLVPGGRLCVAVVHPLNSSGRFTSEEPDAPFVIGGSYFSRQRYRDELTRDGLTMAFVSEHRPLQDYVGTLAAAGLLVEELREPPMPEHAVRSPRGRRWQRVPLFLHLRAVLRA